MLAKMNLKRCEVLALITFNMFKLSLLTLSGKDRKIRVGLSMSLQALKTEGLGNSEGPQSVKIAHIPSGIWADGGSNLGCNIPWRGTRVLRSLLPFISSSLLLC